MIKILRFFIDKTSTCIPLGDLDDLYATAISQLPIVKRREYCQRLINRTKFDLKMASCNQKKLQLERIIKSATMEIFKLDRKVSN